MVEYGVKKLITNPTLIPGANEVIRVVDARSHTTKAFILPASYEGILEKLLKEVAFREWARKKKEEIRRTEADKPDAEMERRGWESVEGYLDD
jgi:predicted HAD superfamily phosphohydrolase